MHAGCSSKPGGQRKKQGVGAELRRSKQQQALIHPWCNAPDTRSTICTSNLNFMQRCREQDAGHLHAVRVRGLGRGHRRQACCLRDGACAPPACLLMMGMTTYHCTRSPAWSAPASHPSSKRYLHVLYTHPFVDNAPEKHNSPTHPPSHKHLIDASSEDLMLRLCTMRGRLCKITWLCLSRHMHAVHAAPEFYADVAAVSKRLVWLHKRQDLQNRQGLDARHRTRVWAALMNPGRHILLVHLVRRFHALDHAPRFNTFHTAHWNTTKRHSINTNKQTKQTSRHNKP